MKWLMVLVSVKCLTVDYTGFGWVMIQNGVFENKEMKYPWFAPKIKCLNLNVVQDMCGEDVSFFCLDAQLSQDIRSGVIHGFVLVTRKTRVI